MQDNFNLYNVQKAVGYTFKDPALIKTAFVCHTKRSDVESNEGLVFLGMRLLDFVLSDYIYSHYPCNDPKSLFVWLENYKKTPALINFIADNQLQSCIITAKDELRDLEKVQTEVFLAIIAAIYRDGGMPSLKAFLFPMLKDLDGEPRYAPKQSSSIELEDASQKSSEKRIKKETKSKPSNGSAASTIQKAETVEAHVKAEKKLTLTEKLFGKKQKSVSAEEPIKEQKSNTQKASESDESRPSRSFIRDALQPVSLPEHMKTPRPKSASGTETKQNSKPEIKQNEAAVIDYQENAKSMLQEYVQKNLRTSCVLIKYVTEKSHGAGYRSKVTLNNRFLADAEGDTKKSAEMKAAAVALAEIKDPSSELGRWFSEQNTESMNTADTQKDYVTKLNEHFQKENRTANVPVVYEKLKVNEKRTKDPKGFVTSVKINGVELGVGKGFTPKEAKQNAAKAACEMLNIN
ncbi:MAG: hypothetical protein E7634_07800 [Ruminococcaceae bacterium]|nr:hypothetical protein [Oscillospiraceae bacterium]